MFDVYCMLMFQWLRHWFSGESKKPPIDDLEAELEADLDDLKLDDIDTTDVNLDDEELLED